MAVADMQINNWAGEGFPQIVVSTTENGFKLIFSLEGRPATPIQLSEKDAVAIADEFRSENFATRTIPQDTKKRWMGEVQSRLIELGK